MPDIFVGLASQQLPELVRFVALSDGVKIRLSFPLELVDLLSHEARFGLGHALCVVAVPNEYGQTWGTGGKAGGKAGRTGGEERRAGRTGGR